MATQEEIDEINRKVSLAKTMSFPPLEVRCPICNGRGLVHHMTGQPIEGPIRSYKETSQCYKCDGGWLLTDFGEAVVEFMEKRHVVFRGETI